MSLTDQPDWTPNFISAGKGRFDRAVLNLPRLLELERFGAEQGYEDAEGGTLFLSRLIIALNGAAAWLNHAAEGDASAAKFAATQVADFLWTFGEDCAALTPRLEKLDDARRT